MALVKVVEVVNQLGSAFVGKIEIAMAHVTAANRDGALGAIEHSVAVDKATVLANRFVAQSKLVELHCLHTSNHAASGIRIANTSQSIP